MTLQTDVTGLRKGIDLILYEREKQSANFVIFSFYNNAVHKVARATEQFKVMQEAYDQVCTAFNESAATVEPFDFFSVFDRFAKNFKKCLSENTERNKPKPPPITLSAKEITDKFKCALLFFFALSDVAWRRKGKRPVADCRRVFFWFAGTSRWPTCPRTRGWAPRARRASSKA